jgi:SAM-dependent methyltransferase
MGLKSIYLNYINECARDIIGEFYGKRMLELGNQHFDEDEGIIPERTGKEYYVNRGVLHTSVDLNGEDGSIKIDLSKPIENKDWLNSFDIITNSGTSEHVEPKKAQYVCFMNIHNCLKVGGIAVHIVPGIDELEKKGCWKKHCNNYYSYEFFEMLSRNNNYKLASLKVINGLICACLQKKQDTLFMKNRKEFLRHIARKKEGIIYKGINDRGLYRFYILFHGTVGWLYKTLGVRRLIVALIKNKLK